MTLKTICKCGHDKDTHFEKKHACLARGCDDCKRYRDALADDDGPETPRSPPPLWDDHDLIDEDPPPSTPRIWPPPFTIWKP